MSFSQVTLSQVELDTVLAALRLFQATPRNQVPEAIMEIATDHSASALHPEEIDELCERLNVSPEEPAGAGQGDYHLVSYGHGEHGEESLAVVDSQQLPILEGLCADQSMPCGVVAAGLNVAPDGLERLHAGLDHAVIQLIGMQTLFRYACGRCDHAWTQLLTGERWRQQCPIEDCEGEAVAASPTDAGLAPPEGVRVEEVPASGGDGVRYRWVSPCGETTGQPERTPRQAHYDAWAWFLKADAYQDVG